MSFLKLYFDHEYLLNFFPILVRIQIQIDDFYGFGFCHMLWIRIGFDWIRMVFPDITYSFEKFKME